MLASFLTTIEAAAALHLHPATCTPWLQRENSWMEGFTPDDPPCRAFVRDAQFMAASTDPRHPS
jgi:hypothetical protein